jgi:hypothetical protein
MAIASLTVALTGFGVAPAAFAASNAGTPDATFNLAIGNALNADATSTAVTPDGHVIVGGYFNGGLKKFDSTGTEVASFTTNVGTTLDNNVYSVAVTSDDQVIVGGDFTGRLKKFDSTGTEVASFTTNVGTTLSTSVYAVAVTPTGRIIVGGDFTGNLKEFDSTGTEVASFTTNVGSTLNNAINAVAVTPTGRIIVGGVFTTPGAFLAQYFGESISENGGPNTPTAPMQAYAITQSDTCSTNAPELVNLPGLMNLQFTGWGKSWHQWPNNGIGGYVCTRQPYYTSSGTWTVR